MAARRDRERRRPSGERRYRFATPESAVDSEEAVANGDASRELDAGDDRQARSRRATTAPAPRQASAVRGGVRPAPLPFSAHAAEHGYVLADLRRVGLVIGSLLLILILLYFVLPH